MQIVEDNLHEMSNPVFWEVKKKFNLSLGSAQAMVKVNPPYLDRVPIFNKKKK